MSSFIFKDASQKQKHIHKKVLSSEPCYLSILFQRFIDMWLLSGTLTVSTIESDITFPLLIFKHLHFNTLQQPPENPSAKPLRHHPKAHQPNLSLKKLPFQLRKQTPFQTLSYKSLNHVVLRNWIRLLL